MNAYWRLLLFAISIGLCYSGVLPSVRKEASGTMDYSKTTKQRDLASAIRSILRNTNSTDLSSLEDSTAKLLMSLAAKVKRKGTRKASIQSMKSLRRLLASAATTATLYRQVLHSARRMIRLSPLHKLKYEATYWKAKYHSLVNGKRMANIELNFVDYCTNVENLVISLSKKEIELQRLSKQNVDKGADTFRRCGLFYVDRVLEKSQVEALRSEVFDYFDGCLEDRCYAINENAPKRFEMLLPLTGQLLSDQLLANPLLMPIIKRVLGHKLSVENIGFVNSMPSAPDQNWHIDCDPMLFPDEMDAQQVSLIPAHALIANFNLIDCTADVGCTEFSLSSHICAREGFKNTEECNEMMDAVFQWRGPAGSAMVYDYRLLHRGVKNKSKRRRPIFNVTYVRKWYRDFCNFEDREMCPSETEECEKAKKLARSVLRKVGKSARRMLKGTEQIYYDPALWPKQSRQPEPHQTN